MEREYRRKNARLGTRIALGVACEALRVVDEQRRPPPDPRLDGIGEPGPDREASPAVRLTGRLDADAAAPFRTPPNPPVPDADVSERLVRDLGISRFVTLNDDFGLELRTMGPDCAVRD